MSDTHPNAFRNEAAEKRTQGNALLCEAHDLEVRADILDGVEPQVETKVAEPQLVDAVQTPDKVEPEVSEAPAAEVPADVQPEAPVTSKKKVEVKEG
jgi:hypothetical protein